MFSKTKIALSAAIVLGTALTASAATKPQATQATGSVYNMIPGYSKGGGPRRVCRQRRADDRTERRERKGKTLTESQPHRNLHCSS